MPDRTCSIDGCGTQARARGWCIKHYHRWKRHGDPLVGPAPDARCSIDGCEKKRVARGLCSMHYWRLTHRGEVGSATPERRPQGEPPADCSVDGCERPARHVGLCDAHYERWRRHGAAGPAEIQAYRLYEQQCQIEDCTAPQSWSGGLCEKHYKRYRKWNDPYYVGDVGTADQNHTWSGDGVGYSGAHDRVRRARGAIGGYQCVGCGGQARDWAYDHQDADPKTCPDTGLVYSLDVNRYLPLCRRCHVAFDTPTGTLVDSTQSTV